MAAIYLLLSILAAFAGLVILCLLRRVHLVLVVVFWFMAAVRQNPSRSSKIFHSQRSISRGCVSLREGMYIFACIFQILSILEPDDV